MQTGDHGMQTKAGRELAFVLYVAVSGIALVLVVAFAPWYEPVILGLG